MNGWCAAREILAIRPDNIGDVIMLGPALRAVKETSPQARIALLASPAAAAAALLLPWIDEPCFDTPPEEVVTPAEARVTVSVAEPRLTATLDTLGSSGAPLMMEDSV